MSKKTINVIAAIDYMEQHLTEKLDLERLSAVMHYSKYYLHRIFTETVGMTLHAYITRRKLTEAARLLVFTAKPILAISFAAGYESQQAFTTAFKEMYKCTPGQYRHKQEFYPLQQRFHLQEDPVLLPAAASLWARGIRPAVAADAPLWMQLTRLTVDGFPHFQEKAHQESFLRQLDKRQAFILKEKGEAIAGMAFDQEAGSIDFLAVHPQYRGQGIAGAFLARAAAAAPGQQICTTTFRSGDKADLGHRKALKDLGFTAAEFLIEFDYPTQRMIWEKPAEGSGPW